jgi:hypothetical protein
LEGDAQVHQELRALRVELQKAKEVNEEFAAKLKAADEKIREAMASRSTESAAKAPSASSETTDPEALIRAREEISRLERALAAANAAPSASVATASVTAESFKELAKQLQSDLMAKVNELSDQVQEKLPSADLQEVTVKRIHPPQEIATAFTSAITFTLLDSNRRPVPLRFPVQAGLDGSWRVPTAEDVQKVYADLARGAHLAVSPAPANAPVSPPSPTVPPSNQANPAGASAVASGTTFNKQADGSIMINWDPNGTAPMPAVAAAPPPTTPVQPAPTPATAPVPAPAPAQPTPSQPKVPAPVMPVQRDIIVRFD